MRQDELLYPGHSRTLRRNVRYLLHQLIRPAIVLFGRDPVVPVYDQHRIILCNRRQLLFRDLHIDEIDGRYRREKRNPHKTLVPEKPFEHPFVAALKIDHIEFGQIAVLRPETVFAVGQVVIDRNDEYRYEQRGEQTDRNRHRLIEKQGTRNTAQENQRQKN